MYTKMVLEIYPDIAKRTLFFFSLENKITDLERLSKSIYKYHDVYDEEHFGPYAMEFFYPMNEEDFEITDFYYKIYKSFDEETAINLIYMNQEDIEKLVKEENVSKEKLENKLYSLQRLTKTEMEAIYPYTDMLFRILMWDNGVKILKKSPSITKELYDHYSANEHVINSFRYTIEDLGLNAVWFYSQNRGNLNLIELMKKTEYQEKYGSMYLLSKIMNELITYQHINGTKLMNDKILFYLNAPIKQVFSEKYSDSSLKILDFIPGYDLFNLIYKASNGYVLDTTDYTQAGIEAFSMIFGLGASKLVSTTVKNSVKQVIIKKSSGKIIKKIDDLLPLIKKVKSSKFVISSNGQIANFYVSMKNIGKIDVKNFYIMCFNTSKKLSSKYKLIKPIHKKTFLSGGLSDARSVMRKNYETRFNIGKFIIDETMIPFMIVKSVEVNSYLLFKILKKAGDVWD